MNPTQQSTSQKLKDGTRGLREGASNVAKSRQVQGLTNAAKNAGNSVLRAFGLGPKQQPTGQPGMGQPGMGPAMGGKRRRKSRKRKGRRSKKRRTKRRRKSRRSKSRRRRRR